MKILITGAAGQLGYDLQKELAKDSSNIIIALDVSQMDISKNEQVETVFNKERPDIVFHCAAYTNVDKAEDNVDLCNLINITGTKNIALASSSVGAKLFYFSTDYVFDGTKNGIYQINDKANPLSTYGLSKYLGEKEALLNPKTFVVRISWAFGINGNNFISKMLELAKTHSELNVVSDEIGSPTYTPDLSKLLVKMMKTEKYGIYHATNEGFVSRSDLAKEIFRLANVKCTVNPLLSKDYISKAKRPLNSKLDKSKLTENGFDLLPTWQDALARYLKELKAS